MPDYAREIIHKGKEHFQMTDGVIKKPVCPSPGTDEHARWQREMHKLLLSRNREYGTLWSGFSAWVEQNHEQSLDELATSTVRCTEGVTFATRM
jgi:hypothetical protein